MNEGRIEEATNKTETMFTIINGNARSLKPKLESFIDCFSDSEAGVGVVSETWLEGEGELVEELSEKYGIGFVSRPRTRPADNGVHYGGVAVAYRNEYCVLKKLELANPEDFEVLVTVGNIKGHRRKLVIIACYLPPGYTKRRGCLLYTSPSPRDRQKSRMPSSA